MRAAALKSTYGFILNTEALKLQSFGGKCSHLGLRSHHKNMNLLAINHLFSRETQGIKKEDI